MSFLQKCLCFPCYQSCYLKSETPVVRIPQQNYFSSEEMALTLFASNQNQIISMLGVDYPLHFNKNLSENFFSQLAEKITFIQQHPAYPSQEFPLLESPFQDLTALECWLEKLYARALFLSFQPLIPNLHTYITDETKLQEINRFLASPEAPLVTNLDLSNLPLFLLPYLGGLPNLSQLSVKNTNLLALSKFSFGQTQLISLDCSDNHIKKLPREITSSLQTLIVE